MQRVTFVVAACALLLLVPQSLGATGRSSCQSVAAVFYTSGDWWRLAQALGANPSPCAQYYVSIPPLAASKTTIRSNAAWQIRAIGPNFHALAEVNYSAWASWVTATGNSWYQAGQEARRRMAAAGYDVGAGDTWAVNEASSAVVAGTGQARQNLRQLLSGLFYGDGSVPQAKGFVFGVGVGQTTTPLPAYKAQLESWLQDDQFWGDMSTYAIAYYQEVYGDARAYAITGVNPQTRESYLLPYLTYLRQLATAGPQTAARSFLTSSYGALANAAWAYANSYGYTNVDPAVMADFVSAQVYALRQSGISYIGFAWDASNPGLSAGDFASQTSAVLARMAGAVHETDAGDPTQACEATGCASVLSGGAPATGWSDFATWTPTVATFTSAPQTLDAGAASQPISLQLQTGGIATTLPVATTVSVTSSSTGGTFANSPAGPWSPTLTLTLPPGTGTTTFYAEDANGGTPTLTATTNGTAETQVETVNAPNPTVAPALAAAPPTAHIGAITLGGVGDRLHLSLNVVSAIGQPL